MKKLAYVFWSLVTRKLLMSVLGVWCVLYVLHRQVDYLYTFTTPEQVAAFTTISTNAFWTITAIILTYLGVNVAQAMSWGNTTTSAVQQVVENFTQRTARPKDFDDGTI